MKFTAALSASMVLLQVFVVDQRPRQNEAHLPIAIIKSLEQPSQYAICNAMA